MFLQYLCLLKKGKRKEAKVFVMLTVKLKPSELKYFDTKFNILAIAPIPGPLNV